jgi:RNA polymerase sigma-70 factor, ECF subfamily
VTAAAPAPAEKERPPVTISVESAGAQSNHSGMGSNVERPTEEDLSRAWGKLYREHFAFVRRWVRRLGVRRGVDQEDVIHDVFVQVRKALPGYDAKRPAKPWLAGITCHVVIDWMKRHREVLLSEEDLGVRMERTASTDPERLLAARDRERVFAEVLGELEEAHRTILVLHFEGLKMAEIAEILEITVAAGYARLERAHAKLLAALDRRRAKESACVAGLPVVAFLAALREDPDPGPDSAQGRIWERLQESAPAVPVLPPSAPPGLGAALLRHGPGFLTGGTVVGIVALLLHGSPAPAQAQDPTPVTATVATASTSVSEQPLATLPCSADVPTARVNASPASPAPRRDAARGEDWLISAAVEDLAAGRRGAALRWLQEHAQRFPHGKLVAERERLLAQAGASAE